MSVTSTNESSFGEKSVLENRQALLGYFYLRLLTSHRTYMPTLNEITKMSFRFVTKPTTVFDTYERAFQLIG